MKNVYQKFICAVILICSQIYMLLYDVKASFGLMDLFIICIFYYLLMKRKIVLKDYVAYVGLLVTGIVLCSMFHPSNILRTGIAMTLAQIFFIVSSYFVYCKKQNKDRYIKMVLSITSMINCFYLSIARIISFSLQIKHARGCCYLMIRKPPMSLWLFKQRNDHTR